MTSLYITCTKNFNIFIFADNVLFASMSIINEYYSNAIWFKIKCFFLFLSICLLFGLDKIQVKFYCARFFQVYNSVTVATTCMFFLHRWTYIKFIIQLLLLQHVCFFCIDGHTCKWHNRSVKHSCHMDPSSWKRHLPS